MLKIELEPGDSPTSTGMRWVDCPPLEHVSDEEWNNSLLIWDQVKNSIHAMLGVLGPLPEQGWHVKLWMDTKKFPKSVLEEANTVHWEQRGFVGPAPKPKKLAPLPDLHWLGTCMNYIEKTFLEAEGIEAAESELHDWLIAHDHNFRSQAHYYLITNPKSPEFEKYHEVPLGSNALRMLELLHQEFADRPDDDGIAFWVE